MGKEREVKVDGSRPEKDGGAVKTNLIRAEFCYYLGRSPVPKTTT